MNYSSLGFPAIFIVYVGSMQSADRVWIQNGCQGTDSTWLP